MIRHVSSWLIIAAMALMTFACAGPSAAPPTTAPPSVRPGEARQFPEVEILTAEGDLITAKLVRLDSDGRVVALPSPYWGVETSVLNQADIVSIRRLDKPSSVIRSTLSGFALAMITGGLWYLTTSKYDEEFSDGLLGAPAVGGVIGAPLGLLIGVAAEAANPSKLQFSRMSEARRLAALRKLMGI
jgi:hypothetical protein